jgi:hypothetical protein
LAKIEQGKGILLSVDTEKRTLRFRERRVVSFMEAPEPKEWEHPYGGKLLEWEDERFYDLVGEEVEYVLSDGTVVKLSIAP